MTDAAATGAAPWPDERVGWFAVGVLALSLLVNFLDRGILALLVPYIKADLALSDTQISLLMGFAFVVFYMFAGLPIARYADHGGRRNLIALGLVTWSLATALCGLARSFLGLFACRIGVGVGEACTGPASFSLLGDLFPPEKLPRAIAVMNFGFIAGTGGALLIGGAVVQLLANAAAVSLPILGEMRVWQAAFIVVGLPGLVVALLMLCVPEPARRTAGPPPSVGEVVRFLVANRAVYGPLIIAIAINTVVAYGAASWGPAFYARVFGWSMGMIGLALGLTWLICAPLGAFAGGLLAERWARQGREDANMRVTLLALAINIPFATAAPLMPVAEWAVVMNAIAIFAVSLLFGPQNAAFQIITPNRMKAQVTAVMLFAFNIIGFGLGPTVTALFTDYVFRDEMQVGRALAACTAILGPIAFVILLAGVKPYARAVAATRINS
jgi:MFS family permease